MLENSKNTGLEYKKLSPEEMKSRGILGRLIGVCADFINPTRNGRKYPEDLWDKVFEDPIMIERIQNGVCYGELGHPADREETDMEKIAVCLAEVPKKGKDGKLRAVFDILDTPNGRILKTLCDYGSTLGISSRGSGDTFSDYDGQETVDSDTYDCQGWDVVLIPAVKEARLQYMHESLEKKKYNKTLRSKLQESLDKATEEDRRVMEETLNSIGIDLGENERQLRESYYVEFWLNGTTIEHIVSETKNRKSIQHELDNMYGKGATEITSIEKLDESMSKVYPMCEIDKEQTYTFDEHADSLDDIEDKVDDSLGDDVEVKYEAETGMVDINESLELENTLTEEFKFEIKATNALNKEVVTYYTAKSAADARKMFDDDNSESGVKFKAIRQINDESLSEDYCDTGFRCDSYYDTKFRGLEDTECFNDIDDAMAWTWEKVQQNCVKVTNLDTGAEIKICEPNFEEIEDGYEWIKDKFTPLREANEETAVNTEVGSDSDNEPKSEKKILLEIEDDLIDEPIESESDCVNNAATNVMAAYQNANKWLDIVKESVYTNLSCVFFSSFIHGLAHTMPGRFDKFGDILHTINMKIPYPATEYIPNEPTTIDEVFDSIFMVLDGIKNALNEFIKCTDETYHGMACATEGLLNDIESEYPMLYRLQQQWASCNGDIATFDKYVGQYSEHKDDLLESLNTSNLLESLKTATPYMLRNDGKLIEVNPMHPYIKMVYEDSDEKCLDKLIKDEDWNTSLQWFYDNTQYEDVKGEIKSFVESLVDCEDFNYTDDDIKSIVDFDYSNVSSVKNKKEVLSLYRELNDAMNQEFCKVRTSNMRFGGDSGDIFFRISSVDFNWFDIIWDFVEKNKNFIESVTICKDTQAFGGKVQFVKDGKNEFNNMPVDEFLTLEGKPVVENYVYKTEVLNNAHNKLSDGESLLEAFRGIHPVYSNEYYNQMKECYVNHSFNRVFNEKYADKPIKEDAKLNAVKKDENLNINEVNKSMAVENNEAIVEELQHSLEKIANLERTINKLQEKLSVCYAKENKMDSEISRYRNSVAKLSESTKKQEALTNKIGVLTEKLDKLNSENKEKDEQLGARDAKIESLEEKLRLTKERRNSLNESISSKDRELQSLTESLTSAKKNIAQLKKEKEVIVEKSKTEIESLNESIAELNKDNQLIKNEYSQKVDKATKLVEKYKRVANTAVDKYIESAAVRLGVGAAEIKQKLPENYSFNDIDDVCERLQDYSLNISKLPFRTLQENIKVQATPSRNERLTPAVNLEDEIDDDLLKLAGL